MSGTKRRKPSGKRPRSSQTRGSASTWFSRAFPKRSRMIWLYAGVSALAMAFIAQHLVHEMLLDIVVYASNADRTVASWTEELRRAGYHVHVNDVRDPLRVRKQLGVPNALAACHTSITIQGHYVLEGDVPPRNISKLLAERPRIGGLAVMANGGRNKRVVAFNRPAAN